MRDREQKIGFCTFVIAVAEIDLTTGIGHLFDNVPGSFGGFLHIMVGFGLFYGLLITRQICLSYYRRRRRHKKQLKLHSITVEVSDNGSYQVIE